MIKILMASEVLPEEIFSRAEAPLDVSKVVSDIINDVRDNGDEALFRLCRKFDKAELSSLLVTEDEIDEAVKNVDENLLRILERAYTNIKKFHEKQLRNSFIINDENGVVLAQKILPLERVGLYVPGGTAAYPSTVLMDAVPAKLAGCREVVIVTPPDKNGRVSPAILAAAKIAGVDKIFKVGGAQAVAALAYGTESIPKADKIVGPGNAYVAEAKRQVFGKVSIDMIAGPSEILIVADSTNSPVHVAADMLAQAEHDRLASAVLVTDSYELAVKVQSEIETQLEKLERYDIARASVDNCGKIIVTDSISRAVEIANEIAPEHLELCVDNPFDIIDSVKNAGSVFMGKNCPEALGDYMAGPNHTLPTSGTARFSSPLSVDDFVKKTQYIYYTKEALENVARDVEYFAKTEGLTAHARSAVVRIEEPSK